MAYKRLGARYWGILLPGIVLLAVSAHAADIPPSHPSLDHGFQLLYNLDFSTAHQEFLSWEQQHPEDPVGCIGDAAGLLFSEFNRLGILEAQFFEDDHNFQGRKKLAPDAAVHERFVAALNEAERRAKIRLARDPKDRDGLFAMTLSAGLQADYAALIEKSNITALRQTKQANAWASQLLAVDPNCYDAFVATGISKYIIGSMAAPVRWILRIGGVSGDKQTGMDELQKTAEHGRYLAPYARMLLAIAYVRDKQPARAKPLLASLQEQFPNNPLFAREIARLDSRQ
jgi:hypothetical protein